LLSPRLLLIALIATPLAACNTAGSDPLSLAAADGVVHSYAGYRPNEPLPMPANDRPKSKPELERKTVDYVGPERPGTVVVRTTERRLYYVLGDGKAIRYPVGVGRAGKQWAGSAHIESKHVRPAWSPPAEVRADNPRLPDVIPGGVPNNPMGERALVLQDEYAIHGTNRPQSVGNFATYGCIRMFNEDIVDLFDRVKVGTEVVVKL
jgi:lipoprotein-anchoring transpeptidase ErfK/SrfK